MQISLKIEERKLARLQALASAKHMTIEDMLTKAVKAKIEKETKHD